MLEKRLKELFREAKKSGLTSQDDMNRKLKELQTRMGELTEKEEYEKEAREAIEKERG